MNSKRVTYFDVVTLKNVKNFLRVVDELKTKPAVIDYSYHNKITKSSSYNPEKYEV
jgi:hypothetical protein